MSAIMTVISVVSLAVTAYSAYESSKQKMPDIPALPATPKPADSLASAQAAADQRRRTILNAGGNTNLTNPLSPTKTAGTAPKTLLG